MLYSRTRLLFPKKHQHPEFALAEDATLAGVAFDTEEGMVLTYDRRDGKLYWLNVSSGDVVRSVRAPLPNENYLVDMCQFDNILYALVYTDIGHLSVFTGNLQQARNMGVLDFDEYPLPYYTPATSTVWHLTHQEGTPGYFRYHPRYCSITNCGHELFILAGMSNDVATQAPMYLGQYILQYDLSGLIKQSFKVDDSMWVAIPAGSTGYPGYSIRPSFISNTYNGLGLAIGYREGMINIFAEDGFNKDSVVKEAKLMSTTIQNPPARTSLFISGPLEYQHSLCYAGRYVFYLVNNRLMQASVMDLELQDDAVAGLYTHTVDVGAIEPGLPTYKYIRLKNNSTHMTYRNMILESRDPNMQLAHFVPSVDEETPAEPPAVFQDAIKWSVSIRPGDTIEFWVRVMGPQVANTKNPHYYYDYLTVKAEGEW